MSEKKYLYEDDYVAVSQDEVKIKTYYFPTAQSKKVNYGDIKAVYWSRQQFDFDIKTKSWGMAFTPVWWGCDMMRQVSL